jgi:hypothetical protein
VSKYLIFWRGWLVTRSGPDWFSVVAVAASMTTPDSPAKYTAEQITEIVARITELRMRWLDSVNRRIALQQEARMRTAASEAERTK